MSANPVEEVRAMKQLQDDLFEVAADFCEARGLRPRLVAGALQNVKVMFENMTLHNQFPGPMEPIRPSGA